MRAQRQKLTLSALILAHGDIRIDEDQLHGQWAVAIVTFKGRGSDDVMRCILASGGSDD